MSCGSSGGHRFAGATETEKGVDFGNREIQEKARSAAQSCPTLAIKVY